MVNVKFNTVDEVNEQLTSRFNDLAFKNYNNDTNKKIEQVFKEVAIMTAPQNLILEDIQYFESEKALKIEYQCQNKHYTMILGCK